MNPRLATTALLLAAALAMPSAVVAQLPGSVSHSDLAGFGAAAHVISGAFGGLLITDTGSPPASDARYSQVYHVAIGVYAPQPDSGGGATQSWSRRFVVHAPDASGAAIADSVARMLLLLHAEIYRRLHMDHPDDQPTVSVWLTAADEVGLAQDTGGEQFKDQIYLFNLFAQRSPTEWARETAHEYGHFALPGITGFTSPEAWANGYLGQRLLLMWVAQDAASGALPADQIPFVTPAQLNGYLEKQVTPLLRDEMRTGPDEHTLQRRDAAGMDAYTGLVCYIDAVYGSRVLLNALALTAPTREEAEPHAIDFLRGAKLAVAGANVLRITPPATIAPGARLKFSVYVPAGQFAVREGPGIRHWQLPDGVKGLYVNSQTSLAVAVPGWQMITLDAGKHAGGEWLQLNRAGSTPP
ncbi:MAG: hypothetical protein KGJ62_00670 [Armatimonadetes bacterium]|nr:hypothetical protein [Armatimonadota bacterium]MDE2205144.1 hypothetical protein [Armatimonadota bacterium]